MRIESSFRAVEDKSVDIAAFVIIGGSELKWTVGLG
jgi:hypothetical protein